MTLDEARAVFAANVDAKAPSFIEALHEQNRFDPDAFWHLYNAVIALAASDDSRLPDTRDDALHLYQYVLASFLWHHSPFDTAEIEKLPKQDLADYVERLQFAFTTLIRGGRGYPWNAANNLPNPRQAELDAYFAAGQG